MKLRIRFSKQGIMKFVGHLDMVRYFQKVFRRAEIDVAYTEGFSPHQKISFAAPLSLGAVSRGEYLDIEVNSVESSEKMISRINKENVDGIKVLSCKLLPDDAKNAMSVVTEGDYIVHTHLFDEKNISLFLMQDRIMVVKKTKKSEKETDIRPLIHEMRLCSEGIFMKVAQGSSANLKPELVMKALSSFCQIQLPEYILYERMDMYCTENGHSLSLDSIGDLIN